MRTTIIRVLNEKLFAKLPRTLTEFVEGDQQFIDGVDGEMEIKVSLIDDDVRCEELVDILNELGENGFMQLVLELDEDEKVKFLKAVVMLVNSLRTYRAGSLALLEMATSCMVVTE